MSNDVNCLDGSGDAEQQRQKNIESITQEAASNLESEEFVSDEPVDEDHEECRYH